MPLLTFPVSLPYTTSTRTYNKGLNACEGGEHSVGDSAGLHTFLRDDILASTRKMRLARTAPAHTELRSVEL